MDKRRAEGVTRLCAGFALNVGLWLVLGGLSTFSSIEREVRLSFIGGGLAVVTWVLVTPIFWRGEPWQAPVAFILIAFFPSLVLYSVIATLLR
jgi:hypothetical protein